MKKVRIRVKVLDKKPSYWTPNGEMNYLMGREWDAVENADGMFIIDDGKNGPWTIIPEHAVVISEEHIENVTDTLSPDEKQVGGSHYADMSIEPWEVIERAGLDFWDGNAVKYTMRHGSKNGVEDLRKAIHYIEKKISILEKQ